jgi:hypothetical protein
MAEVTVALMIVSALSAAVSPVVGDLVGDARQVQVASDLNTLAVTFTKFSYDARMTGSADRHWQRADVLVGEGLAPAVADGIDAAWAGEPGRGRAGRLVDHLQSNAAGYETPGVERPALGLRGWRGPYLSPGINPDAWGHRYVMNVASWSQRRGPLVLLSAGPNGVIETPFDAIGAVPGGDDLIAVVSPIGQ